MVRCLIAFVAVFIAWFVMDFLIHGVMLRSTYEATAELWRPEAEMKTGLMLIVIGIAAAAFNLTYSLLVDRKNIQNGLLYGLLTGIATGVSMGYGTYSYMPIPYHLALSWFLATVAEALVAGLLLGLILRSAPDPSS